MKLLPLLLVYKLAWVRAVLLTPQLNTTTQQLLSSTTNNHPQPNTTTINMSGTMDKIKAKVDNVLHKDKTSKFLEFSLR